jgi:Ca2+-transporting ATPase
MGGNEQQELAFYRLDTPHVLKRLHADRKGLSYDQVEARLEQYGPNQLKQLHKESNLHKYLRQYKDLMIILLLVSGAISFLLEDARTAMVLLLLVLFNTIIGYTQEFKAEKLMESLERLVVTHARVMREGELKETPANELVPGDIAYIEAGDAVPADLRLLTESELATNDFALTGESEPARKFTHAIQSEVELGNRHNLVFMGTTVATGHAYGVVIATGMQTELGRIASLSESTAADPSPLQHELNHIATRVTQGTLLLCAVMLPIAIHIGLPFKDALLFAIGIAASLIPQGLPAEINTALAQAANKLAKARALVKKLSAVESLGATTVICTDKTGTLTKNEMTVQQLLIGRSLYEVSGSGYENNGQLIAAKHKKPLFAEELADLSLFFTTGVFASNARVEPPDDEHPAWHVLGDPTEGALITLARKGGLEPTELEEANPELKEFAFDSGRKRMSSIRRFGPHGQYYVFVKGAPESVLEHCDDLWDHGHVRPLVRADKTFYAEHHEQWAKHAMRNLAYAYKVLPHGTDLKHLTMEEAESGLTFLGLVSMIDPLRDEVAAAVADTHAAHIKLSIITGDYAVTAQAIAERAGLGKAKDIPVISGDELRRLDDSRVLQLATQGGVIFSRVSPEDKLRIVELIKESGKVVAVTGDGINDAPALKRADIGVAMGMTGTDVAKQSAEIVLLDDSFHTLVGAVQQGRIIFQNIKKGTLACLTSNSAELVVNLTSLAAAGLFSIPLALTVMQILAIDLIAELFPIAALGWDKADHELMHEPPRDPRDHIINRGSIIDLLWCGLLIGGFAFINYILFYVRRGIDPQGLPSGIGLHMQATAMTYLTIVLCQLANILQRRSQDGLFTRYQLHNKQLGLALLFSLFWVLNIIYNPLIAPYFGAGPLNGTDWLFALGAAGVFIAIREIQRHADKHHNREAILELLRASA